VIIMKSAARCLSALAGGVRCLLAMSALLLIPILASPASWADAKVTLCHSADEAGLGMNLRRALTAALNPNTATNTITFQCGGPATIEIDGPLEIMQATAIDGGTTITLTSSNSSFRSSLVVVALTGNFLYLRNLTLTHPNAERQFCDLSTCVGTVLNAQGFTEFDNVVIQNTDTPIVASSGTLTVSQSQLAGNTGHLVVTAPGATLNIISSGFQDNVGAMPLLAGGTTSITASHFSGQSVASFFPSPCQQLTVNGTTFDGHTDGVLQINCSSIVISNSQFNNNSTPNDGGVIRLLPAAQQISIRASRFFNNHALGRGGAIWFVNPARSLFIGYSSFTGNQAGNLGGGAIYMEGVRAPSVMKLQRVSFSRNLTTGAGGAIRALATELLMAQTVFADNQATVRGGAVALENSTGLHAVLANTLLIRNKSAVGSAFSGDDADFINSTVDSNQGLALESRASRAPAPIHLRNTIISNNPQGGCGPAASSPGAFVDGGHNLQFPGSDCGAAIPVANPHLDTMYIPLPLSPPFGHGDPNVCRATPISGKDVYGSARLASGLCAIGAAEGVIRDLVPCQGGNQPDQPQGPACYRSLYDQLQKLLPNVH
jgi:predicted outer membrane repeat protein